jgi:protein TonB
MRKYTLVFSIATHVVAACALVIVPLLANDVLPEPRRATEFIQVVPLSPPAPEPPHVVRAVVTQADPAAAPLVVPDTIQPEPAAVAMPDQPLNPGAVEGIAIEADVISEPAPPPTPAPILRVGGDVRPPTRVANVAPVYPPIARASHIQGIVILEATIGEEGSVRDVRVLRSIPLLDTAAVDAVRQWRFTPTLLNGQPVPVVMTVTVGFTLQ